MLLPLTVSATPINSHFSYYFQQEPYNIFVFRFCYHVTLSYTPISNSHQPFLSTTFISYLYLLYLHAPIRYPYQNSLVTNHYQLRYHMLFRSRRSQRFFKIGVLKNFAILTGKHLHWRLFLIKLQALRRGTLLKKDNNAGLFL